MLSKLIIISLVFILACSKSDSFKDEDGDLIPSSPPIYEFFTVNGYDVDRDGIRDDLEILINKEFTDLNTKRALKKVALNYQKLITSKTQSEAEENQLAFISSRNCLFFVGSATNEWPKLRGFEIADVTLNNYWRKKAARESLNLISSERFFRLTTDRYSLYKSCDIKIDGIEKLLTFFIEHKSTSDEARAKLIEVLNEKRGKP